MNWIDVVCLIVIALFTFLGVWSGLIKSVFRLAAWVFAALGAYFAYDLVGAFIISNFDLSTGTIRMICMIGGFLVPLISIYVFVFFVDKWIKKTPLNSLNRVGGGLFGLLKSLIICFLILTVISYLPLSGGLSKTRRASFAYQVYNVVAKKDFAGQMTSIQNKVLYEIKSSSSKQSLPASK